MEAYVMNCGQKFTKEYSSEQAYSANHGPTSICPLDRANFLSVTSRLGQDMSSMSKSTGYLDGKEMIYRGRLP